MDAAEQALHEELTAAFIAEDPYTLTIYRPQPKISDGAGGKVDGPPIAVRTADFRIIPQSRNSTDQTSQSFNGNVETPRYVIMGVAEFRFERDDFFTWLGSEYKISSVHQMPRYESKADMIPTGGTHR